MRTTAFLFTVGGSAGVLLALDVALTARVQGVVLLLAALVAVAAGAALLALGPRVSARLVTFGVVTSAVALGVSTAWGPAETALASSSLVVLIAIESVMFLDRRLAWLLVLLAAVCQGSALVLVHATPPLVVVAFAVVWAGVARAVDVLARRASTADVDPLTGLPDRRSWDAALERAIDRRKRKDAPLSLALVDIDNFKRVNDRRGRAAGDELLRATADAWRALDVPGMVIGRRGGDEFAVLMPGTPGWAAHELVDRFCAVAPTAVSCGVAEHVDGESGAEVLRRTDVALYAAKTGGRGRTVLSQRPNSNLLQDLTATLGSGRGLRVDLQPIVDLATGTVVAVEALARWSHPRRGHVPPLEFVRAAEDGGLIDRLGSAVLALACRDARALQDAWGRPVQLSVNASGRELVVQGYAERVLQGLEAAGWPVSQLVLEVTESVVEGSGPAALRALHTLRDAGARVAIDDFGTGFSSFSRLDELPADILKLDRQFLTSLTTSPRRAAMVRALLQLCAELDVLVVAEGVETQEQMDRLVELGCPAAQGYHLGRPQPAVMLARSSWEVASVHG